MSVLKRRENRVYSFVSWLLFTFTTVYVLNVEGCKMGAEIYWGFLFRNKEIWIYSYTYGIDLLVYVYFNQPI